ncbi:phage major capsid protein, partial [Streptococcus anginosus]
VSIVYQDLKEQKILLLNDKILNVMKTFTAKTVSSVDELKAIKNVALDPGYKHKVMVVSASFYQWLDTLKDKDDNYILNRS